MTNQLVIHNGDDMNISFDYEAPPEGMERSFVLYSWATFKHAKLGTLGRTVDPIPYVGMPSYSESTVYPLTEDNINYLNTWNTRVITGSTGGSSTVITSSSSADVSGYENVGGLVGYNDDDKLITGSSATGNISGEGEEVYYLGGLVGENYGTVTESHASGDVTGGTDSYYLGGLVGDNENEINTSYAIGNIEGYEDIGGLVGYNDGEILAKLCIW